MSESCRFTASGADPLSPCRTAIGTDAEAHHITVPDTKIIQSEGDKWSVMGSVYQIGTG